MAAYNKAVVAVVGAVVAVLAVAGIDVDESLAAAVVSVVTALLVYVVPNK